MPFVPVANVAQVQFVGQIDGQETVNDLYFVSTAPPISQVSLAGLVGGLLTWFGGSLVPLYNDSWHGSVIRARDLTSQFAFVASVGVGTLVGGISGEAAPNNCSSNITFGTDLAGRNNHGSNRVPALSNSLVDLNTIDVDWQGSVASAYAELIAPSTALPGGWTWVVVSRFSGVDPDTHRPIPRVAGIFHEVFSAYFVDQIVDSQKTRLPKHGR